MSAKKKVVYATPQLDRRKKAEEIIIDGLAAGPCTFNDLFGRVWPQPLKSVYEATGEEIMRLRLYEFLQHLASMGHITKVGKEYSLPASKVDEIVLGLGDVTTAARGKTYDKMVLSDFKRPLSDFWKADTVVFDDGKGYRRVLKERNPSGKEAASE